MTLVHISMGGSSHNILDASGKLWMFEDHPYCGPIVTKKNGDPAKVQPGKRSLFWDCVHKWYEQGKEIKNGLCVWQEPKIQKLKHLGGKNYMLINK